MSLNTDIKFFIYCSGKTGSKTLAKSLERSGGVFHAHSELNFRNRYPINTTLKELIERNAQHHKVYIIDSYREPIDNVGTSNSYSKSYKNFLKNYRVPKRYLTHLKNSNSVTSQEMRKFMKPEELAAYFNKWERLLI